MAGLSRRTWLLGGAAGLLNLREALGDIRKPPLPWAGDADCIPGPFQLAVAHVVVRPDFIRGVLRVHNPGPRAWAVADRWNSWGAYLWEFTVAGRRARNPVDTWDENRYTETVLAPSETRALRFSITAGHSYAPLRNGGPDWPFCLRPLAWEEPLPEPPPFGPATRVDLRWKETERKRPAFADILLPSSGAARAAGISRAHSKRLDSLEDLLPWLEDRDGRRLPSLP